MLRCGVKPQQPGISKIIYDQSTGNVYVKDSIYEECLLMISVAFRGFEGDGQSVKSLNGETPFMSPTRWLSDPTRGTGVLTRTNGSYEKLAMVRLSLDLYSSSKSLCESDVSFNFGCCGY